MSMFPKCQVLYNHFLRTETSPVRERVYKTLEVNKTHKAQEGPEIHKIHKITPDLSAQIKPKASSILDRDPTHQATSPDLYCKPLDCTQSTSQGST